MIPGEGEPDDMGQRVMPPTEEAEVGQVGGAAVEPMSDVVEIAMVGRLIAAGDDASSVSNGRRPALPGGGEPR